MIKKFIPTKLKWLSYNSKKMVPMCELSDDHLHNIIFHINFFCQYYDKVHSRKIVLYALERGINIQEAVAYQKPFLNSKGEMVTWDYSRGMEGYPEDLAR